MTTLTSRSGQLYVTIEGREYPTLKEQENDLIKAALKRKVLRKSVIWNKLRGGIQIPDELVELERHCPLDHCKGNGLSNRVNCNHIDCHTTMFAVLKSQDQKKEVEEIEWPSDQVISIKAMAEHYFNLGARWIRDELKLKFKLTKR